MRASFVASGGIGVPCSALARVQAIRRFWQRHTMPQTLSSMIVAIPPPKLIESVRFPAPGTAIQESSIHPVAITTIAVNDAQHPTVVQNAFA